MRHIALFLCFLAALHGADVSRLVIGEPMFHSGAGAGAPAFTTHTIDQTTDKVQAIIQMPEAATITTAGFCISSTNGTPVEHKISLQGVSATSGEADGTILGGGTPASKNFTPGTGAACRNETLDNSIALTRGQVIAIVVEPVGTPDGSNNIVVNAHTDAAGVRSGMPYAVTVEAGTGSKNTRLPPLWIRSASKTYGAPITAIYSTTLASDSTPDEVGTTFSLPSASCDTYKVVGARWTGRSTTSKSVAVKIYDGTTAQQSVTTDIDQTGGTGAAARLVHTVYFSDASLTALTCGTTYRIAFAPQETGAVFGITGVDSSAAGDLSAWGGGTAWQFTSRTDAGAWSDTDTRRLAITLILDDITEPAGGGGTRSYATVQ